LRGRIVKDPQVSVSVEEVRSQQVTIDGAVKEPGVYPVMGPMTLQRAVALAKGMDEYARLDQIVVFRTVNGQPTAAQFDLKAVREGRLADPQIYGNDVIVVGDNSRKRNMAEVLRSLPILGVFTPLVR
jgi:polysaccharide export outer membrane protein